MILGVVCQLMLRFVGEYDDLFGYERYAMGMYWYIILNQHDLGFLKMLGKRGNCKI